MEDKSDCATDASKQDDLQPPPNLPGTPARQSASDPQTTQTPLTPPQQGERPGSSKSKATPPREIGQRYQRIVNAFLRSEKGYRNVLIAYDALLSLDTLQRPSLNVDVKRICILGYQSVGKSTFLEALANHHISLPKGEQMVTKSPIRLTLRDGPKFLCTIQAVEIKDLTSELEPLGHLERGELIKKEYELALQALEVAPGKICTSKEVKIEVHAPGIPNLSLLDLPGAPPEVHKAQLDTALELHRKFADDENCLVVVLDSDQQGDNDYIENKANSILKKAIAAQRILHVYNIRSGTSHLRGLYSKMRARHNAGQESFAVRLESTAERESGDSQTAHEAEQEYRQKIRNGGIEDLKNLDDASRQWFAKQLGIDYCQNVLAKRQMDLVVQSMSSAGLLTKVENVLEIEQAAIKKVEDETCVKKTAIQKLRDIDSYAQKIHSIVEKAITSGELPQYSPAGSSKTFSDASDPVFDLYAIIPKVYDAEKGFLQDAKTAAIKFITEEAKEKLREAFRQQIGFSAEVVTQHRTVLKVTLTSACRELHALALAHIDKVNKLVEEAVHNMIYSSKASENAIPEHLPNLVKHFKSAVTQFFHLKREDAKKQCQTLISCLIGTMRWEMPQTSDSPTTSWKERFDEALEGQKKLLYALQQKNKEGGQLWGQPATPPETSASSSMDTDGQGPQENQADGSASSAAQPEPVSQALDSYLNGEDEAFCKLMNEALTLLIDVQEKFSDMLLRTSRMIQINSVHMDYLAPRQQESRLLEKFLKERTDNNEKAVEEAFEIPPEHMESLERRKTIVRYCEEFKKHFANLKNSI